MKKLFLMLVILISFSCKNETKNNTVSKSGDEKVLESIVLPNHPLWLLNTIEMEETDLVYNKAQVFNLNRTNTTETAYATVNNIDVTYGNNYIVSVIVKQASIGGFFGLRIIGIYPNRVDTVFDLNDGTKKEVVAVGDFFNGNAKIESLADGWYKCSVMCEVNADKIKIILGPTTGLAKAISWEAATQDKCNVYIIPTSLTLEEF